MVTHQMKEEGESLMESPLATQQNLSRREECVVDPGGTLHCGNMLDKLGRRDPLAVMWFVDQRMNGRPRARSLDKKAEA